ARVHRGDAEPLRGQGDRRHRHLRHRGRRALPQARKRATAPPGGARRARHGAPERAGHQPHRQLTHAWGWVTTTRVPAETPYFSRAPTSWMTDFGVRAPRSKAE